MFQEDMDSQGLFPGLRSADFQTPMFSGPPTPAFGPGSRSGGQTLGWPRAGPLALSLASPDQGGSIAPAKAVARSQVEEDTIEERFASIVQSSQQGTLMATDTLKAMSNVLDSRAKELRDQHLGQQGGFGSEHLAEVASRLSQESALWKLLVWLRGDSDPAVPGGFRGPTLHGAGSWLLTQQKAAQVLSEDLKLNKVARVIAWAEQLAGEELESGEEEADKFKGYRTRFSEREGLPLDSRDELIRLGPTTTGSLCSQLDPDAPTREQKLWTEDDVSESQRITEHLWKLVCAGRIQQAQEMCHSCGQAWRAATLGSPWGPRMTPVGPPAYADDSVDNSGAQEHLASEIDIGGSLLRDLWRSSCYQAAESLMKEDKFEAAIYGLLGGNLSAVLPVCDSWHQKLWAFCRIWLETEIQDSLKEQSSKDESSILKAEIMDPLVSGDRSHVRSWEEVRDRMGVPLVSNPTLSKSEQQQLVMWNLIQGFEEDTYRHLIAFQLPSLLVRPQDVEQNGSRSPQPGSQIGTARVAAHVCLALMDLGLIPEPHMLDVPDELLIVQEGVTNILSDYVTLLVSKKRYSLVPHYLCRLPQEARRELCCDVLLRLTKEGDTTAQKDIFAGLHVAFQGWFSDQQGDVEQDELAQIAEMVAGTTRWVPSNGPALKAHSAAWLWKTPETFLRSLQHTNALLREFCFGEEDAIAAALLLLKNVPAEVRSILHEDFQDIRTSEGWQQLVNIGIGTDESSLPVQQELQQLFAWSEYIELYREFSEWRERVEGLEEEAGSNTARVDGGLLLNDHLHFLSSDGLAALYVPNAPQTEDLHLKLLLARTQSLQQYSGWDDSDCHDLVARIKEQLQALNARLARQMQDELAFEVQAEDGQINRSLVQVTISTNSQESLEEATSLMSLLLKGLLIESTPPLQVVNMDGTEDAVTNLCKCTCYAHTVLHAAHLRMALVRLGEPDSVGEELIPLVAGDGQNCNYTGLVPFLPPRELQEILEMERLTLIAHKLNTDRE